MTTTAETDLPRVVLECRRGHRVVVAQTLAVRLLGMAEGCTRCRATQEAVAVLAGAECAVHRPDDGYCMHHVHPAFAGLVVL